MDKSKHNLQIILMFLVIVGSIAWLNIHENRVLFGVSIYASITVGYLLFKLLLSSYYRPFVENKSMNRFRVAVVIPVYNEKAAIFSKCLSSVLSQTKIPDEIYVIDDGSYTDECLLIAKNLLSNHKKAKVIRLKKNRGKRYAQAIAFRQIDSDFIVTIDSDTVPEKNAIEEGLKPFSIKKLKQFVAMYEPLTTKQIF